ncbi:GtrA family protein [Pedobacter metabolipauper]|uniref:Putative flippase GtrA n=1 Tax=Pedobacter metabolipauper TaxID=425513 RepID=A0A4R6SVA5_9SPHI|nr:GtrA family protein [Pedobacter metabolipauper]TDQ08379.1 putative flippase GtrA [Pedobacter metabolipauper]
MIQNEKLKEDRLKLPKKTSVFMFIKAQLSAFVGGIVDYSAMIACTELLGIHYTISIAIGGVIGAILNFSVNRYWTFNTNKASNSPVGNQLVKFIFVVAGSIFLKSSGTYLFTTFLHTDYKISRLIIDIIVSLGFNYVLQTYWVFRKRPVKSVPL